MSGRGITKAATWRCALAALIALLFALLVLAAAAGMQRSSTAAAAGASDARYALANGCYALRSRQNGKLVARDAEGRYAATAGSTGEAEAFRMKATALGSYLFYGRAGDFLAAGSPEITDLLPVGSKDRAASQATPNEAADWTVDAASGAFQISLPYAGGKLLATSGDGQIVIADPSTAGDAALFAFEPSQGCATFPEVEVNATGTPSRGATPFGEVRGLIDAHIHGMAFEFLGGRAHCGRPWSPYGVTVALVDCPDHITGAAPLETGVSGTARHDPAGWPTFKGWPTYNQLTHEQTYYKWLERSWRGGLRLWVNLLVDNHALCELYPLKKNSCNEMDSVRLQAKDLRALENYIDAQEGGPGKGWFRIVESPYEARRVINEGKLAVVMGIENSKLFDCGVYNGAATCDRATIDRELDEVYKLGVRDMELVNKFDNGLAGVAGDSGTTGEVTNTGNKYETNRYWDMKTCKGPKGAEDRTQLTPASSGNHNQDELVGNGLAAFLPPGTLPAYPPPPHCNERGLTELGAYVVKRMIAKRMIVDPDHLSVRARNEVLSIVEAARYSGIVSSHSWSTPDALPRIYRMGGVVTPYAGSSTGFVKQWRATKPMRSKNRMYYFGFGYGADMNGFGSQGGPRGTGVQNPVTYPFKSFDGKVTLGRQVSGQRVYDINADGVAHYGLYPDWIEDLRKLAGDEIVNDMARGSEAYLQMWERADGVKGGRCQPSRNRVNPRGVGGIMLGDSFNRSLRRGGQPLHRLGRVWSYCVRKTTRRAPGRTVSVLTPKGKVALVVTTAPGHRALNAYPTNPAKRLGRRAKAFGRGIRVRSAGGGKRFFYGVRRGRIRYVGVASRSVAKSRKALRAYLKLSGVL